MQKREPQSAAHSTLDYADAATSEKPIVYAADLLIILVPVAAAVTIVTLAVIPQWAAVYEHYGTLLSGGTKLVLSLHKWLATRAGLGLLWAGIAIVPWMAAPLINRGRPTRWLVWIVALLLLSLFLLVNLAYLPAPFMLIGTKVSPR